jgi:hypothetical protein
MAGRLAARALVPHPRPALFAHKAALLVRGSLSAPAGIYFADGLPGSFCQACYRSILLACEFLDSGIAERVSRITAKEDIALMADAAGISGNEFHPSRIEVC